MSKHKRIAVGTGSSLLLRLPATDKSIEKVAEAHWRIIAENGSVWLGIVGKTYSAKNISHIKENGEFLYLVQNTHDGISVYKGEMSDVNEKLPETQYPFVPRYYHGQGITDRARIWVKLLSLARVATKEIEGLRVVSSGRKASVLLSGMAYLGIVERE